MNFFLFFFCFSVFLWEEVWSYIRVVDIELSLIFWV
jgi:hypothetical protein